MYQTLFFLAGLAAATCYGIFNPAAEDTYGSGNHAVTRISKLDEGSEVMPRYYDVEFWLNGETVRTRLSRYQDSLSSHGYRSDWAGYTSKEPNGVFIIRRDNITNENIEGYLVYGGVRYLIQPSSETGGHRVYKTPRSNLQQTQFDSNSVSVSELLANFEKIRRKRDEDLLKRQIHYKCQMIFDSEALRLAKSRLRQLKKEGLGNIYLTQFALMTEAFVDDTFKSLKGSVNIAFKLLPNIQILEKPMRGVGDKGHYLSKDFRRLTSCSSKTHEAAVQFNSNWESQEHLVVFTGMGVRMDGSEDKIASQCSPLDNFIMSPNVVTEMSHASFKRYSTCTKKLLVKFLKSFPPERSSRGFHPRTQEPHNDNVGALLNRDEQCWLATDGRIFPEEEDAYLVCILGLRCQNWNHIIRVAPFPGTPCKGHDVDLEYWCQDQKCIPKEPGS